jgi:hypothetical protein
MTLLLPLLAQTDLHDLAPKTPWAVAGLLAAGLVFTIWKLWQQRAEEREQLRASALPDPGQAPACKLDHSGINQQLQLVHAGIAEIRSTIGSTIELARETASGVDRITINMSGLAQSQERFSNALERISASMTSLALSQERISGQQLAIAQQVQNSADVLRQLNISIQQEQHR